MGSRARLDMWLFFLIAGLQVGLLAAVTPDSKCDPNTEFSCRNDTSLCIALSRVRDGQPDCPDTSDEECFKDEFQCQRIHQCVPSERFHDGWPDCDDGTDEECGQGQHRCLCGLPHCVDGSMVKDGVRDCEDGSDEDLDESQSKSVKCSEENKLQDLLAVEKKRRKRQIHRLGTDEEDGHEMSPEKTQTTTTSAPNNFQYSYTKFLNERLSREQYDPSLPKSIRTPAVNIFRTGTRTDSYGSLISGKIYQTAVSEPTSVVPTAELTTIEFDDLKLEKMREKTSRDKHKKVGERHTAKFSDVMLKIAALFSNGSETVRDDSEISKEQKVKGKLKVRKLLSINKSESRRKLNKRDVELRHIPLTHSPTVPYMPESDVHTTGVVLSTTGTDVVEGRTTEWTTVIEGTFIRGTYAHIVHSTSKIYYTVDDSEMEHAFQTAASSRNVETSEIELTSSLPVSLNFEIPDLASDSPVRDSSVGVNLGSDSFVTPTPVIGSESATPAIAILPPELSFLEHPVFVMDSPVTASPVLEFEGRAEETGESDATDTVRSSQRRNDKSLRFLDEFISVLSSSTAKRDHFIIEGTALSSNPSAYDHRMEFREESFGSHQPSESFDSDFSKSNGLLPSEYSEENVNVPDSEILNLEGMNAERMDVTSPVESVLEATDLIKNIDLREDVLDMAANLSNFVARMASKENMTRNESPSDLNSNINPEVMEKKNITHEDRHSVSASVTLEATSSLDFTSSSSLDSLSTDVLELIISPLEASHDFDSDVIFIASGHNTEKTIETSLKIPEVTDLLTHFGFGMAEESSVSSAPASHTAEVESIKVSETVEGNESVNSRSIDIPNIVEVSEKKSPSREHGATSLESVSEVSGHSDVLNKNIDSYSKSSHKVMVYLGIASTITMESSATEGMDESPVYFSPSNTVETEILGTETSTIERELGPSDKQVLSQRNEQSGSEKSEPSAMTVLLLPSMNLEDLESFIVPPIPMNTDTLNLDGIRDLSSASLTTMATPFLENSKPSALDSSEEFVTVALSSENDASRKRRAVSESVTILRPEGRIVSTDARVYLTPTTHYTTYTYFTTMLLPNGRTQIRSSLHVDSVILEPTDRPIYGYEGHGSCNECDIRSNGVYNSYETQVYRRPVTDHRHNIETVAYEPGRASEITHRTTFTYYTTRFRGGTSSVETRKVTETNVTPVPTGRYSPFEIGTHYDGGYPDDEHYHTEVPYTRTQVLGRPTYTYFTTVYRNGIATVETRRVTNPSIAAAAPTHYRPVVDRTAVPIDPNLYKPDRVTHRTTYTYHTTRFRDGVPVVHTRRETETNVTPIPTYTRPVHDHVRTVTRVVPARPVTHYVDRTAIDPYPNQNPFVTHRTTYTYYTTRLRGGSAHVDTRYVTETNLTPNPTVPYVRGTVQNQPHYDGGYYDSECRVCDDSTRGRPAVGVRGRVPVRTNRRSEVVDDGIKPSTATLYSTYTYATTQLTRGQPVVRTREHTVTEVLSDVVLPTLKFGDRIRSKRTVRLGRLPVVNDTEHVVPITHTFSRTSSYADGRQGRRIPNHNLDSQRPNRRPVKETHRHRNTVAYDDLGVKPTSVTFYSTYTYFTTELENGRPVTKSREHTVTEILTDVIVPTITAVRGPAVNTQVHRRIREAGNGVFHRRNLLSAFNKGQELSLPSVLSPSDVAGLSKIRKSDTPVEIGRMSTPPLGSGRLTEVANDLDDLVAEGAEMRPVTHFTTNTYYATKINPGGRRVVETRTKVSSSVSYPDSNNLRYRDPQPRTSNQRRIYSAPALQIERTRSPDNMHQLDSRVSAHYKPGDAYSCPSCSQSFRNRGTQDSHFSPSRRHGFGSRRKPHRLDNTAFVENNLVKPTKVTYYSTYTYFTTEPHGTSHIVKTREHTVTEVLTDVIVPTVASLNKKLETIYPQRGSTRYQRDLFFKGKTVVKKTKAVLSIGRKLLNVEKAEIFTTDSSLLEEGNYTLRDNNNSLAKDSAPQKISNETLLIEEGTGISDYSPSLNLNDSADKNVSVVSSEIFNNDTSQLTEVVAETIENRRTNDSPEVKNFTVLESSVNKNGNYPADDIALKNSNTVTSYTTIIEDEKTLISTSTQLTKIYSSNTETESDALVSISSAHLNFGKESSLGEVDITPSVPSFNFYTLDSSIISKTPAIDLFSGSEVETIDASTPSSVHTFLFGSQDLEAAGAEVRHAIVATPVTHYTTYTYYTTVLKPGGKRLVETNTKVTAATVYPELPKVYKKLKSNSYESSRCCDYLRPSRNRFHDLQSERAVARTLTADPAIQIYKTYRIQATQTRAAQPTAHAYKPEFVRCPSCQRNNFQNEHKIPNHAHRNYLTSVPARRGYYQERREPRDYKTVNTLNTIPYAEPSIKPTRVTYYSTYTYFTTELQNGSPVVRSREHTVTEILTDVIVPTVSSVSQASKARYLPRYKRDSKQGYLDNVDFENNPFRRKLLSVDTNSEIIEETNDADLAASKEAEGISEENELLSEAHVRNAAPTAHELKSVVEMDDNFRNNAQFSKAYVAYLEFLEKSGTNASSSKIVNSNYAYQTVSPDYASSLEPFTSSFATPTLVGEDNGIITVLTSDLKKNGRMTKYTTTIYGTYINGVYAQKASSKSNIVPLTETDASMPVTTLLFSPSRLPGLVRSVVSRKVRGPVAVHLTTEIYGTFVAGAYAQTARVFTSSQPLSSTREPMRHRVPPHSAPSVSGSRKTGLLSTRVLRTKMDGQTTLLFVSEIYGTYIGGAYAHLGTYTMRTLTQTESSSIKPEPTSKALSTFHMEDLTTGLITASVSDKVNNGTTVRYHYEVYGTYLEGTYAHVPSISTETISLPIKSTMAMLSEKLTEMTNSEIPKNVTTYTEPVLSPETKVPKIGLIQASTRAHVNNGTTTQHIFQVHGTYLNGNYAHVPTVSVVTIEPKKTEEVLQNVESTPNSEPEYEILMIFMDEVPEENATAEENMSLKPTFIAETSMSEMKTIDGLGKGDDITIFAPEPIFESPNDYEVISSNNINLQSQVFPVLLPEALRLSFSSDKTKQRNRRSDPFAPYLRSSFTESVKYQKENQRVTLLMTTPLPASAFDGLSLKTPADATKTSAYFKKHRSSSQSKSKQNTASVAKGKNVYHKCHLQNSLINRAKRSPSVSRSGFGSSKRFGATSSTRRFGGSSSAKRGSSSSSRVFQKSSEVPTKSFPRPSSKSVPSFLSRNSRSKPDLIHKASSKPIPSRTSKSPLFASSRMRRFGKKDADLSVKPEEDIEASETIPQSVTEVKLTSPTKTNLRLHRPSKFSKFNPQTSTTVVSSRPSKITSLSPTRRSRLQLKSSDSFQRNRKTSRDRTSLVRPTVSEISEVTSSKKRFTLTTTFEINVKPTSGFMMSLDDDGNNLQGDEDIMERRKSKSRNSGSGFRNRKQGSAYKPVFDSDDNEVRGEKSKSLPLPVFGRSRGVKRPPKFDPRTIKATSSSHSSTIIYLTPTANETNDVMESNEIGPVTITSVYTTIKTLPVHLGLRTSFATITTTAFETSVIPPSDLTTFTVGSLTKTLVSAITSLPNANLPLDKQFTVVEEVLLTTTEVESTSLVAIKVGFGTRTDTIVAKHKMTTLTTQTNTLFEEKTAQHPLQNPYPFFQNPFLPPVPTQNTDFSLSLSENSFVSTETVTSTTVLPLFFNGKTILTTLTSTSLSEATLVKTTTIKVPQPPSLPPFVFPQPVFIMPSVTTELTVHFTAHNGEVFSIVTLVTIPLALNGHTRFARSVSESAVGPSKTQSFESTQPFEYFTFKVENLYPDSDQEPLPTTYLHSSFPIENLPLSTDNLPLNTENLPLNSKNLPMNPENLVLTSTIGKKFASVNDALDGTSCLHECTMSNTFLNPEAENEDANEIEADASFRGRRLLQFDENIEFEDDKNTQSNRAAVPSYITFVPDTFHLIGPGFNEEPQGRPIPSVRVVPTRRAYVRRLKPSGSQNLPFDGSEDEFIFRQNFPGSNSQNFPTNINLPEFTPSRPGPFRDQNFAPRRNVQNFPNRFPLAEESHGNNYGTIRNPQYFAPNRPNLPSDLDGDSLAARRVPTSRPGRIPDNTRNQQGFPPSRNSRPQVDGFDAIRNLPSYTPTRLQNQPPALPPAEEVSSNVEGFRNQVNRPVATIPPRRVIRLRRPGTPPPARPDSGRELMDRKPIVNSLQNEKESPVRARGPVVVSHTTTIQNIRNAEAKDKNEVVRYGEPTEALPLTYYTTFTYMTTFLNGPSTAYSTREAIVSNIATETLNPRLVGLIKSRGGFMTSSGIPSAVPLGSRAQGATTTIVNLASRVQLYNSDVYYGKYNFPEGEEPEPEVEPIRTVPITDIASLPKTYYTQFTYFYTLKDGDKSTHSQRSETISNVDEQTEPFVLQDFKSTVDGSGFLTLNPEKKLINLGLRTAGGTTTEVNLELRTLVRLDGMSNVVVDRGSIAPTLVEVHPPETDAVYNNYLDAEDAEVQDQQTYPQTVPIQPSFSSANEVYSGTKDLTPNREATPAIPSEGRIVRTQSLRGPLRVASTLLQRPGSLRSGVFAPRPGVRVRVRPVTSRIFQPDSLKSSPLQPSLSSLLSDPDSSSAAEEFDDDELYTTEEADDDEDYTTEDTISSEEEVKSSSPSRKRLKITIRRSPGISGARTNSAAIRPTRTRPRFYVVTRTASPSGGSGRQSKRPVSVKISRKPKPSAEPKYETYTSMTSVPVVFGLSTTYRNALVTSSSLVTPAVSSPEPSKTVILTYFTTTTYTVPFTVDGVATYTTLEETNSRIATEVLAPDADLSFVSTTTIDSSDGIQMTPVTEPKQPGQTLKPQIVNNQLNVGPRINLATKISNGVTLIVATDGEVEATHVVTPAVTLKPTMVTDALHMKDKDVTTVYEPRTFYTTFTFFTTFFSGGIPSTSTSEQVITNVYSVPVTQTITRTQPAYEPVTVIETSENLVSTTMYTTQTFYATLFNGTETVVTPIEERKSTVVSSTETYTITKTIMPTPVAVLSEAQATTTTTSVLRTTTNYVTLFRGTESIVSPLEEVHTDFITLTLDDKPSTRPKETYTTRTIQATNTHYVTLFSGTNSILSSITEVAPSVITELVKQLQETSPAKQPTSVKPSTSVEPTYQDLVPSVRTQYTTLTYFTTLFTDSSVILSSREEVATSFVTLFVPAPVPGVTSMGSSHVYTSQTEASQTRKSSPSQPEPSAKPTSEILTFYTTYTYYTTLFRGTETIISDSETVVTQYVTIESTPTDSVSRQSTTAPPVFSRTQPSDSFEIRIEPTTTVKLSTFSASSDLFDEDLKIIGISSKVESSVATPSILTGIPTTDANGETHILFTDFIVPSSAEDTPLPSTDLFSDYVTPALPDLVSSFVLSDTSSHIFEETTIFPHESSTPSSARDSASDLATTRLTDIIATHHMVLQPTSPYQSGPSQTLGLKPGAVIDLSDVLTNTNLVGNLGETIKDIVNLFAANGNRARNATSKSTVVVSSDSSVVPPSGGVTISNAEDHVFIPIGAIARSTAASSAGESKTSILHPSTMLSGFTPLVKDEDRLNADENRKIDSASTNQILPETLTSIVFGSNTIFIQPSNTAANIPATLLISDMDGRFHSSFDIVNLESSSDSSRKTNEPPKVTPHIKYDESTSLVSGLETIFFGFPDARAPPKATTQLIQGSASTSSVVGIETIFFDSPEDFFKPGSNKVRVSGETTIFGTFPAITESTSSSRSTPQSTFTTSSGGETTIFFPVPGENQQNAGTRYVTSVESVTLTLTLTTSSVYQTDDTSVTVTSVLTTTIPPRTFVSTIIGDRTILGTQPEPTEAIQVVPTMQASESTTTVTTTTLIFNSIATTVVRTLVIPTNALQPTKPSTDTATDTLKLGGIVPPPSDRPKVTTSRTTPRKPIQLFKSGNRPTDPTTPKPLRTGPPLKLFPTKPPTTTTQRAPTRPVTTRKTTFRKPGKTLVPLTDGCPRECNLKNKEVCKQNPDKTWSCQCRPGFFKKNGSEECRDVKSYVVLVRVLQMGGNEITYSSDLSNNLSPQYKNLTTTARKAVDDAYKTSSVGDDFVSTNVLSVIRDRSDARREGVLVNLTVQLSGEKPANEEFLKEELAQSLEAAASDIDFANATVVSPIIQKVEDVQDFDECADNNYNDCSRSSICINLPGTYTCQCKDGYQDLEPNLPGRICSGEIKDCDYCNNRGICILTEDDNKLCRCYRMYLGKQCEINGLVLAIALPIALALLILTMFCLLCGCRKLRQRRAQKPKPNVFKGMAPPVAGTLDRKAMIVDSSSESSGEHRSAPAHHHTAYDGFADDVANSTMRRSRRNDNLDDHMSEFQVPTVLIPRAKHSHPKQVNAPYPHYRMPPPHGDMDRW